MDKVEINSDVTFESFKFVIAEGMDISVNKLNIGYTLSTWALKEPPTLLAKASHLAGLFDTLKKEMVRMDKAKKKGNNTKDLFVKIKDLSEANTKKAKGSAKKVSPHLLRIICLYYAHLHGNTEQEGEQNGGGQRRGGEHLR